MFAGQATQVTCMVSEGDIPLDISWLFQGFDLITSRGLSVMKVGSKASVLIIDPAHSTHSGNYTCIVENPAGIAEYTTQLDIHGIEIEMSFFFSPGSFLSI